MMRFLLLAPLLAGMCAAQNTTKVDGKEMNLFFGHRKKKAWLNWHRSINVGGDYEDIFYPKNSFGEGARSQNVEFLSGLSELQDIVKKAEEDGKRLRAYGSRWALSQVAYTSEYVVQTWGLNFVKVGIDNETYVADGYKDKMDKLVFTQSGVMVQDIHRALFDKGLALSTTGASDGQRFVGAVSTGTHGSANRFGSMQDYVRGIHLVVPDGHVFIQRSSDPAVTQEYADFLGGATLINDDDMFNAAVVSFGSFGLIHGMLFEAEPLYRLRRQSKQMAFRDVQEALTTMKMDKLGFKGVDELPFHFEVTLNPYRRRSKRKGAFVRVFQKIPVEESEFAALRVEGVESFRSKAEEEDIFEAVGNFFTGSKWTLGAIPRRFLYRIGVGVPVARIFDTRNDDIVTKYPFEFFTSSFAHKEFTPAPLPGTGMELGFPQEKVMDALNVIFDVIDRDPTATPVAVRFVKSSNATLAFTKFEGVTATIEMPGPYTRFLFHETKRAYQKIFDSFESKRDSIPHSYHWGQYFPVNDYWVKNCFGEAMKDWMDQRSALLDAAGREMFASDLIVALGLHE